VHRLLSTQSNSSSIPRPARGCLPAGPRPRPGTRTWYVSGLGYNPLAGTDSEE
jgi:hypothetical protein